jgi:hypothetical protein
MTYPIRKEYTLLACDTALTISGTSRECDPDYFASNVTGATWTLTTTTITNGMAHQVTIRNDTATVHSGKTALLTGFYGIYPITETVTLPAGNATVKSTKYFSTLSSIVPSATIGTDTMDIGICEISITRLDGLKSSRQGRNEGINTTVANITAIDYSIQYTRSDVEPGDPNHRTNPYTGIYDTLNWFDHEDPDAVNATGNIGTNTQEPPVAYRWLINSYTQSTTPTIDIEIMQQSVS